MRLIAWGRDAYREGEGGRFVRGEGRSGTGLRLLPGAWGLVAVAAEVGRKLGVALC